MPEGDTIHRTAARLRPALVGREVVRFRAHRSSHEGPPPGTLVDTVEAHGKHLLIGFTDGWTLQTHMRMTGSWHLYRPRERWRRPAHLVRALVEVGPAAVGVPRSPSGADLAGGASVDDEGWVAVCFSAPVVELVRRPRTDHLGPDLCRPDADLAEVVRRMGATDPDRGLDDVLLDQRICCGVGNVYKSEVAWAVGTHPRTPVGVVDGDTRHRLVATAARLLQANLTTTSRTTVGGPAGALAVYGRRGEPCRRCGTPIQRAVTGTPPRSTYWCPRCQPAPAR